MVLLGGLILENPEDKGRAAQAFELFRIAALRGNTDAEYNLGVCLRRGFGVAPNREQAEHHYRSAASRGHESAQLALGDLIAESAVSEAEWRDAYQFYQQAANRGNPAAKSRLAEIEASRLPTATKQNITAA